VISGFNSDIDFQGVIYHVQTEDKGLDTPIILSLVYSRGEILASKRSPYEDLIVAGFNEGELNDRLQRQHKLIIAAIRAGRIEDLKRMTMKEAERKRSSKAEKVSDLTLVAEPKIEIPKDEPAQVPEPALGPALEPALADIPAETVPAALPRGISNELPPSPPVPDAPPIPKPDGDLVVEIPVDVIEEPIFEDVEIIEYGIEDEEETILPADAVKIITDHVGLADIDDSRLKIRLLGRTIFSSGQEATLDMLVAYGGKLGKGVGGAHIMVKVVGSSFKPLIFHTRADDNGIAQVHVQIPDIKSGRAALLIKSLYNGEEVELRHVIAQR
jgi:hypothetical protein